MGGPVLRKRLLALTLCLVSQPSGGSATIKWITVGGRTSAYVAELQKLAGGARVRSCCNASIGALRPVCLQNASAEDSESDLTPLEEEEEEEEGTTMVEAQTTRRKRKVRLLSMLCIYIRDSNVLSGTAIS